MKGFFNETPGKGFLPWIYAKALRNMRKNSLTQMRYSVLGYGAFYIRRGRRPGSSSPPLSRTTLFFSRPPPRPARCCVSFDEAPFCPSDPAPLPPSCPVSCVLWMAFPLDFLHFSWPFWTFFFFSSAIPVGPSFFSTSLLRFVVDEPREGPREGRRADVEATPRAADTEREHGC